MPENERTQEVFLVIDGLLWEYIESVHGCNPTLSKRCLAMINVYKDHLPLEKIPTMLKFRLELHEILVSVISAEDMELVHEVQNDFADSLQHAANTYGVEIYEEDEERMVNVESVFTCYRKLLYLRHTEGPAEAVDETLKEIMNLCPILRLKYDTIVADSLNENIVMDDITMGFHRQLCLSFVPFHRRIGQSLVLTEEGKIEEPTVGEQENGSDIENSPPPLPKPAKKRKTRGGAKSPVKNDSKMVVVGLVSPEKSPKRKPDKRKGNKSRQLQETEEESIAESPVKITNRSRRMSKRSEGDASINDSVRSGVRMKWTDEEAKFLVDGVKKHGYANWAAILADRTFNFAPGRTNVNLKDKWRNLRKQFASLKVYEK